MTEQTSKWADAPDAGVEPPVNFETGLTELANEEPALVHEEPPADPIPPNQGESPADPVVLAVQDANPVADPAPVVAEVQPATIVIPATSEVVRDGDDHDKFVKELMASRQAPVPEPPVPPKPTARQWSATEEEMRAGAARVKYNEEQKALRPQPLPEPNQPTNVPVFRPDAYTHEHPGGGK